MLDPIFRAYPELVAQPWLDRLASLGLGADALDVGCGTGAMTLRLAERGYRVRGVDHSAGMLEIAARESREQRLDNRIELQRADVRALPYDNESFDVVTCQGVLHHLEEMRPCVAEIARVLKPGGAFYLAEPCVGDTPATRLADRAARVARRLARPAARHPWEATTVPGHEEGPIAVPELTRLLDELGLDRELEFWSTFAGMHRVRPLGLQRWLIKMLCRPWLHRRGNTVTVMGRKPPRTSSRSTSAG